jgi:hypothetical protein
MAGRPYLERVAQPLSPGDPVLFPAARAPGDEARGEAERRAPEAPSPRIGRTAAAVQRRAAIDATAPPAPARESMLPLGADSHIADVAVTSTLGASFHVSGPAGDAFAALERASLPRALREGSPIGGAAAAPTPPPERQSPPPMQGGKLAIGGESAVAEPRVAVEPIGPARRGDSTTFTETLRAHQEWSSADASMPKLPLAERAAARELSPTVSSRAAGRSDTPSPAPRIHIGVIEVRTTPSPPAAPAAPRALVAPPAPISRGYGWRFGLIQS